MARLDPPPALLPSGTALTSRSCPSRSCSCPCPGSPAAYREVPGAAFGPEGRTRPSPVGRAAGRRLAQGRAASLGVRIPCVTGRGPRGTARWHSPAPGGPAHPGLLVTRWPPSPSHCTASSCPAFTGDPLTHAGDCPACCCFGASLPGGPASVGLLRTHPFGGARLKEKYKLENFFPIPSIVHFILLYFIHFILFYCLHLTQNVKRLW